MLIQSTPALHPSRRFSRIFKSSSHCPVGPAASGDGGSRETYRSVSLSPPLAGEGASLLSACDGGLGVPLGTGGTPAATWGQESDSILRASILVKPPGALPTGKQPPHPRPWDGVRTTRTASGHRCCLCCFARGPPWMAMWSGQSVCQAHPSPPPWQPRALWTEVGGGPQRASGLSGN